MSPTRWCASPATLSPQDRGGWRSLGRMPPGRAHSASYMIYDICWGCARTLCVFLDPFPGCGGQHSRPMSHYSTTGARFLRSKDGGRTLQRPSLPRIRHPMGNVSVPHPPHRRQRTGHPLGRRDDCSIPRANAGWPASDQPCDHRDRNPGVSRDHRVSVDRLVDAAQTDATNVRDDLP